MPDVSLGDPVINQVDFGVALPTRPKVPVTFEGIQTSVIFRTLTKPSKGYHYQDLGVPGIHSGTWLSPGLIPLSLCSAVISPPEERGW
jgi:hypothetical protein